MSRRFGWSCFPVITTLVLLAAMASPLRADKEEDAVVALAVSRAKAELALKNAQAAVDEHRSGWASTWQVAEVIHTKTCNALEARQQAEERNAEDARDQVLLEQIQTRLTKLHEDWDAYNAKEREALNLAFQEAAETVGHLAGALEALGAAEKSWKDANLDPATLQAAYDALAKRAAEMHEQADKTLAAAKAKQKAIQAELDDVNAFLGRAK